jgi:hypothetical protein
MYIVYAHFGSQIPIYLIRNISNIAENNPTYSVVLLSDQFKARKLNPSVQFMMVEHDLTWGQIQEKLEHPKDFRKNFWFTSLIRLYELGKFATENDLKIIHIESDVILSHDFPFDKFLDLEELLAFPLFNQTMGIASTLFINGKEGGKLLMEWCISSAKVNAKTTDMLILGDLFRDHESKIKILPSFVDLKTKSTFDAELNFQVSKNLNQFGGIFDGLEIGQYIFGEDPRNNRGFSLLRNRNPYGFLKIEKAKFEFLNGRSFPYLSDMQGNLYPVFSMHVHSKNLALFEKNNSRIIAKYFNDLNLPQKRVLYSKTLINSIFAGIKRRIKIFSHYD